MPRSQTARPRERAHARSGSAPSARPATHRRLVVPFMACGVLLTSTLATWYAFSPARTMTGRGIAGCSTNSSAAAVGQCAPGFALADSHGRTLRLTHYRGHPVLLNFWGVGCDQCALELPDLKRFADPFTRRGGVVLGVNT